MNTDTVKQLLENGKKMRSGTFSSWHTHTPIHLRAYTRRKQETAAQDEAEILLKVFFCQIQVRKRVRLRFSK